MRRLTPPDPYVEAKLLGILLSGVFGQTRADCDPERRLRLEPSASGVQRVCLLDPTGESKT